MKQENPVKNNLQTFAHNVAWLRNHYGLSKSEMARIMGIGVSSLNRIEKGEIPAKTVRRCTFPYSKTVWDESLGAMLPLAGGVVFGLGIHMHGYATYTNCLHSRKGCAGSF